MKICWYQTQRLMKVLPDYIHFTVLRFSLDGVLEDAFRVYDIPLPRRLVNASDQRRAEYLAGRIGAQKLLQHFDSSLCAPLMADDRAPSWPSSFCGAISHDRDFASAAVIKMHHGRVGIDIESLSPKIALDTISQRIASAREIDTLANSRDLLSDHVLPLLFSAKESAYKAFPRDLQQHLDFHSIELREIDPNLQQFTFSLTLTLNHEYEAGFRFNGWYTFLGNRVLTLVHLH
ncbi:4'-phosphopantetheinyl transferase family protein [Enterobacter cloacae]|uniref:4'-phosphopantetheinyl transferase family protein n=1 Tax=Enterobacter cloacae TaxID=550 RepID=UPI00259E0C51|nr:4'-phosphopantetheinyl transferase superfamily protein [Enterobacter cloacae]EKV5785774.1 4'-phosphopantetheinyl transferase superfamily protein [Enterobacter cloacae]HCR1073317.1 4'-phosphopantetheinyl transferase superfamily protein [Enterobacter cloacae]